ncbi:SRPBCC domain-containing protein [Polycladidibacter hongkongensis]|uniref:SRPBCC domain-containing protein n=1 Tax=Polycladidibacter hongkongensis TaxID=1647556 RepID=UPI000831981C|nr:SRPBCC domain-containing protein [Pseudovibrio hongkongensis]
MAAQPEITINMLGTNACVARVRLPHPPALVYDAFTTRIDAWWPSDYRFSPEEGILGLELEAGGGCYEDVEDGRRIRWGTILAAEQGKRLQLAWQISPLRLLINAPEAAGEVTVTFLGDKNEAGEGTMLELTHDHFDRYGENWQDYLNAMASPAGWSFCLSALTEFLGELQLSKA